LTLTEPEASTKIVYHAKSVDGGTLANTLKLIYAPRVRLFEAMFKVGG